ncbi:MAG: histidinol dehydrogenase [Propionibacteriaceae bacterium]|nr:histidinol dehydrogenase [Propionibacteriaceae bacterium]
MLRTIDLREQNYDDLIAVLPRADFDISRAMDAVVPICHAVRERGEAALREFSERFDHVAPEQLRVPARAIKAALDSLSPELRAAITVAIERRRTVATTLEVDAGYREAEVAPGAVIGYRVLPVDRVGLYVPGGLAPLASSVLHNAVPALAAGVRSVALASPPRADFAGLPHPTILAVCALLGIDEVYAVGGAQAIAMFGYGVPGLCPRVDMVTGPGNVYVVAAKRYLRGVVGIDSEAGPSEICVWADDTANPAWVAADLISQAEHDPLAASVLVTESESFAAAVNAEIAAQLPLNPLAERLGMSLGGNQSAVILVADHDQALQVVDAYAAEHLEIQTVAAERDAMLVRNAGAVFVGPYSPVPLGDYSAGSTHVLPTSGAARFSAGLTARSYLKAMHYIKYDAAGLEAIGSGVAAFAMAEELPGHRMAIVQRVGD